MVWKYVKKEFLTAWLVWLLNLLFFIGTLSLIIADNNKVIEQSALSTLTLSLKLGMIGFIWYTLSSYEFSAGNRKNGTLETFLGYKNIAIKIELTHIAIFLASLMIWLFLLIIVQVQLFGEIYKAYHKFFWNMIASLVLYCFFPGFIGILLGTAFSGCSRQLLYFIVGLDAFLASPVFSQRFSSVVLGDKISLASIIDWVSLYVPNANWYPDGMYGIGIERSRWVLAGGWASILLGIILLRYRKFSNRFIKISGVLFALISVSCCAAYAMRGNDFILIKDDRTNSSLSVDNVYYTNIRTYEEDEAATFKVSDYDLEFRFPGHLEATAKMQIDSDKLGTYDFTLYHGYKVKSVSDGENKLKFSRDGDHLSIVGTGKVRELTITYYGNAGKYYANDQAVLLPGYFAYYPIPGKWKLWDYESNSIRTDIPRSFSMFHVKIDGSKLLFMSNLPAESDYEFSGSAQAVTVFAGIITETTVGDMVFVATPLEEHHIDFSSEKVESAWNKLASEVGDDRILVVKNKKVFILPPTVVASYSDTEEIVIYDDHILVSNANPQADMFCAMVLLDQIPKSQKQTPLYLCFSNLLDGIDVGDAAVKPDRESMDLLYEYDSASEIEDVEQWNEYILQMNVEFMNLFQYQVQALGRNKVMKEVYQFLLKDDFSQKQVDFLYRLGEERDD